MKSPIRILANVVVIAAAIGPASAGKFMPPVETALNVALGCQIVNHKELTITNTTGAAIAAGTRISYSYVRDPDRKSFSGSLSGGQIAPGQVVKKGIVPAFSCSAWFRRQPVMAQ